MTVISTTFGDEVDTTVMGSVEGNDVVFGMAITVEGDTITIDYGGTISDDGTYMEGAYTISTGYTGTWAATTGTGTVTPPPVTTTTTPTTTQTVAPTPTTTTAPTTIAPTTASPTPTTTTTTIEPATFTVSDLVIEPKEIAPNEPVSISVIVANTGGSQGSFDVELYIHGVKEETKTTTLTAGDDEVVSFSVTRRDAGTYSVAIYGQTGSFTVMLPVALKIEVTSKTWREGEEPFDIYSAIEEKLVNTGIKVVTETSESYDATFYIEYEETKGGEYSGGEFGTNIHCNLQLLDNSGTLLFERTIVASTSYYVIGKTLYYDAITNFQNKVHFKYLGDFVGTGFGFGDEVSVLISALQDEEKDIRSDAADALGEIGDINAVESLVTLLLEDEDYSVRSAAAQALGAIGDVSAVSPLSQALFDEDNANVRKAIAKALGEIGDASAVEPLCRALVEDEDQFVRSEVAGVLIVVGNTEAVEPLIQALLNDEYWYVRANAAQALGEIGDSRAVEPLTQALSDEHESVRFWAQRALDQIQAG
jgi:hypothetical protein